MKADFTNKFSQLTGKIETSTNGYDRYLAVSIMFLFTLLCILFARRIYSDGLGYWRYLPGLFIEKNISFKQGYTIGVALMEIPFFLIAHVFSIINNIYEADGYSLPYQLGSFTAQIFYSNLGLIYVYKTLRKFYSVKTSVLALAAIVFSTGLFYYSSGNFSHVFSFCAIAMFLYYVFKAYETARIRDHIIAGLLLGIVACCRVPNAIVVLIYIFYGIKSPYEFIAKAKQKKTYIQFAVSFISFLLVFTIQMLYWKYAFGSFIVNSYGDQGFPYLFNPQVYNVLFSLWRGLFIWHPIYLLVFAGFYFLFRDKNHSNHLFGTAVFFIIYIWITSAWWCWWYGSSFGQRTFNDILAVLALPLAALIEKIDNISPHLFKKSLSPPIVKTAKHKDYFPVNRLPFAILLVFISLFSVRNVNFALMVRKNLFPLNSPDIHGHLPYKFNDFMFILKHK